MQLIQRQNNKYVYKFGVTIFSNTLFSCLCYHYGSGEPLLAHNMYTVKLLVRNDSVAFVFVH